MFENGLAPAKGDSLDSWGQFWRMNPPTRNLLFDRFEPRDEAFLRPALQELKLE